MCPATGAAAAIGAAHPRSVVAAVIAVRVSAIIVRRAKPDVRAAIVAMAVASAMPVPAMAAAAPHLGYLG